ncbi:MAG: FtsL-like putative cell division protein [bacterium]|nr:FtsL-like putative cell division protein [bacterium]
MFNLTAVLPQILPKHKSKTSHSVFYLNLAILFFIVFLGLVYLIQLNSLSTKGYEIRQQETKINDLRTQYKHLEGQVSNLQSISRIKQEASKLNFVPASDVSYINNLDFALK